MAAFFGLAFWAGVFTTMVILYNRSGLRDAKYKHGTDWREFLVPNLPWFGLYAIKSFFWPILLVVWLVQGQPASPWRAIAEVEGRPARKIVRV